MPKPQKRRPERLKPSLKQLTPIEHKKAYLHEKWAKERWEYLLSLNKWKEIK